MSLAIRRDDEGYGRFGGVAKSELLRTGRIKRARPLPVRHTLGRNAATLAVDEAA